jgi:hypothetical protein
MKYCCFFGLVAAILASLSLEPVALAQGEQPVVVEYVAPTPECASSEAFQALLKTDIARTPMPERTWRFSVKIRRQDGLYEGTLTTESGVRTVTATRCDDVTAALALIIAMAEPEADAPAPPASPDPPSPTPPASAPVIAQRPPRREPPGPEDRGRNGNDQASHLQWRVGARGLVASHPSWAFPNMGGLGVGSVELPWGFRKMMFEIGVGTFSGRERGFPGAANPMSSMPYAPPDITYLMLDSQACLMDLPIENTGLSALGCLHVAGARFTVSRSGVLQNSGGALWGGAGVRLRWQTPIRLFLEANADAMYGTVSEGEDNNPGWLSAGASIGFQI